MKKKTSKVKTILITGVSSGIGRSIVNLLLERHANTLVIGLGRTKNEIHHPNYRFISLDLTDKASVSSAAKLLRDTGIDIFINNAGSGYRGTVEDLEMDNIRRQFEINYFGPIALLKGVIPQIRKQTGKVINIAALGSLINVPTFGYYNISKLAFSKTLEVLQEESDLKISNIYLGAVKSDFGKNIIETVDTERSHYKSLYAEWQNRFKNFFSDRSRAEEVARLVESIIYTGNTSRFLTKRDRIIAMSKVLLPNRLHQKVINYYYKI